MNRSEEHSLLVNRLLIGLCKIKGVRAWKQTTGVFKTFQGQPFKIGTPGQADIGGIVMGRMGLGVCLQIEVKTGAGRQSKEQKAWEGMILSHGGVYIVARDFDKALAQVQEYIVNF